MKIDEEKLYQAYYEPDRLWAGGKAIKELQKITSMSKKKNQIMVSQRSSLVDSYTTSKRNISSSLRCDKTQRTPPV